MGSSRFFASTIPSEFSVLGNAWLVDFLPSAGNPSGSSRLATSGACTATVYNATYRPFAHWAPVWDPTHLLLRGVDMRVAAGPRTVVRAWHADGTNVSGAGGVPVSVESWKPDALYLPRLRLLNPSSWRNAAISTKLLAWEVGSAVWQVDYGTGDAEVLVDTSALSSGYSWSGDADAFVASAATTPIAHTKDNASKNGNAGAVMVGTVYQVVVAAGAGGKRELLSIPVALSVHAGGDTAAAAATAAADTAATAATPAWQTVPLTSANASVAARIQALGIYFLSPLPGRPPSSAVLVGLVPVVMEQALWQAATLDVVTGAVEVLPLSPVMMGASAPGANPRVLADNDTLFVALVSEAGTTTIYSLDISTGEQRSTCVLDDIVVDLVQMS